MLPHAHVTHHVRGRIRFKLPKAKGDHNMLQRIQQHISAMPAVRYVETNPLTGSVLAQYVLEGDGDFLPLLAEYAEETGLFSLEPTSPDSAEALRELEANGSMEGPSKMARAITEGLRWIDEGIRRETGNFIDLKVLLPVGVGLYSIFRAGRQRGTPLWMATAFFTFTSFISLHGQEPRAASDGVKDRAERRRAETGKRKGAHT